MTTKKESKFIKPGEIRVRIAPSPTGPMHVGLARTALFNYVFAKQNQGSFILRIEDTDTERSKKEWEKDIIENLEWLGIKCGEELYRQSERKEIYKKYLEKLLKENKAYYCFCSKEELEAHKQYEMSIGKPPIYSGKCRDLSSETIKKYLDDKKPSIIRFKTNPTKIKFQDLIREEIEFDTCSIGDFSIAKSLDISLYNFAAAVDDFEMKISHVIRGEDHISNTPKQILIQNALDFPQPKYAHLSLILGQDRAKLSKRHGAVSVREYAKDGYLPEAMINFMALLGWNPGTEKEIFSIASLIKEFSLEKCQKGGAVFNIKRLDWVNGFYIRKKSVKKLTEICIPYLIENGLIEPGFKEKQYPPAYGGIEISQIYTIVETKEEINLDYLEKIIGIYQERLRKLSEISELTDFFFKDKLEYEKELLIWKEMSDKEINASLGKLEKILSKTGDWTKGYLETVLLSETEKVEDKGKLLWPLRGALTGKKASAGPFEIAEILGKEKTLKRIRDARKMFKVAV